MYSLSSWFLTLYPLFTSAPAANSAVHISVWPLSAASIRGVSSLYKNTSTTRYIPHNSISMYVSGNAILMHDMTYSSSINFHESHIHNHATDIHARSIRICLSVYLLLHRHNSHRLRQKDISEHPPNCHSSRPLGGSEQFIRLNEIWKAPDVHP